MQNLFEIIDKRGKHVRLTFESWSHIRRDHPQVEEEEIMITLTKPFKIVFIEEKNKAYFFRYFKHKKLKEKYLRVIVKYLNGEGYIITSHFVKYMNQYGRRNENIL